MSEAGGELERQAGLPRVGQGGAAQGGGRGGGEAGWARRDRRLTIQGINSGWFDSRGCGGFCRRLTVHGINTGWFERRGWAGRWCHRRRAVGGGAQSGARAASSRSRRLSSVQGVIGAGGGVGGPDGALRWRRTPAGLSLAFGRAMRMAGEAEWSPVLGRRRPLAGAENWPCQAGWGGRIFMTDLGGRSAGREAGNVGGEASRSNADMGKCMQIHAGEVGVGRLSEHAIGGRCSVSSQRPAFLIASGGGTRRACLGWKIQKP